MTDTSFAQQLAMSNLEMTSQIMQGTFKAISNISGIKSSQESKNTVADLTVTNRSGKLAYAVEGDSKYDEEIDTNDDGIITYNEYVKYVTSTRLSKYNVQDSSENKITFGLNKDSQTGLLKFSITNMTKILTAYMNNANQLPSGFIEKEA